VGPRADLDDVKKLFPLPAKGFLFPGRSAYNFSSYSDQAISTNTERIFKHINTCLYVWCYYSKINK
jgi:hypothetical protein